jgi:mannobiose 2-epimerase
MVQQKQIIENNLLSFKQLNEYKTELQNGLKALLEFWVRNTPDNEFGGFYGKLDNLNKVEPGAPKGSVLNSRILWSFSAAYNLSGNKEYLEMAERAYNYITDHFIDKKYGGVYWLVDYKGNPYNTKKQIYALSFAIYGLSEFYKISKEEKAREQAIELYHVIVRYSYDKINGGYLEALSEDWKEMDDLRLSGKDANEKKSMNTHLHVLEGFVNLYRVWPDVDLNKKIAELLHIFLDHIIDKRSGHLVLFFDEQWKIKSNVVSYGHDIEAAWLLLECAEIINDKTLIDLIKAQSIKLADAAAEGLDKDGGLWYEYEADENHLIKEKHSWPQAEAMLGFYNAWQITGDENYLKKSLSGWHFVQDHILDKVNGEWFWGVTENYSLMKEDKVGIWKCPYHNSRACIELIGRINRTMGN